MQNYTYKTAPMETYERIEHPLGTHGEEGAGLSQDTQKSTYLDFSEKKKLQALSKKQDRLKSEPYFKPLSEKNVRETDHTITLDSGKRIPKSDISIS